MDVAVDGLSPVSKAHALAPAAANQAAWNVHIAVASSRVHSRVRAVGRHAAQVGMAEAACSLWAVAASPDLACEMGIAYVVVPELWAGTVSLGASVARADIWEGLLLGPGSLGRAAPSAAALPVERAVTVGWVSRVDAEGCVLVPRGLACVVLAIGRVDPGAPDGVVDVLPVTAHDPTYSAAATGGHRVGSPWGSGTRHKGVYDLNVMGHFDRWVMECGCLVVGQQCLSAEVPNVRSG